MSNRDVESIRRRLLKVARSMPEIQILSEGGQRIREDWCEFRTTSTVVLGSAPEIAELVRQLGEKGAAAVTIGDEGCSILLEDPKR